MSEIDNEQDVFTAPQTDGAVTPQPPDPEKPISLPVCILLHRLPIQVLHEDPLKVYWVDLAKDYPPMDYLLTRNGVGCVPRGDIQGLGGKMKNGKTTAGLCMIVAILKGQFMGFEATGDDYKCLIVDTEQSIINAAEKAKIVHRLLGWPENVNNPRLRSLSLRNAAREKRMEVLAKAIEVERPDFVLLDGVADICVDFMDSVKSRETIDFLMKLSKTCATMCVLHTNKKDEEFRGHLGTELVNKCSEAYVVAKTDGIAKVKQTICRNAPLSDWAFSFGENGVPEAETILSKADEKKDELSKAFAEIFQQKSEYTYKDLCEKCMEQFGVRIDMSKKKIKTATESGIIGKDKNGIYHYGDFADIKLPSDTPQRDDEDIFSCVKV